MKLTVTCKILSLRTLKNLKIKTKPAGKQYPLIALSLLDWSKLTVQFIILTSSLRVKPCQSVAGLKRTLIPSSLSSFH